MTTTTLAVQLADAEREAAGPRQQAAALHARLTTAVSAGQFDEAARVKPELEAAREASAIADARLSALRDAVTRLDRERADEARELNDARQRARAERDLNAAVAAEQHRMAELNTSLAELWDNLAAAQRSLRAALALEAGVTSARSGQIEARRILGHYPDGAPGLTAARANTASVLAERDPLLRQLAVWAK
jgi:uncharacterized coiled-coil protein SlyX